MSYHSRASWGARSPKGSRNSINAKPLGTAIHWNGPACASSIRSHSQCPGFIRGIQNFHMDGRGWSDIAYTMFACPHGDLFEGRGKGVGTAANGTTYGNSNYYAIYAMWGQGDGSVPKPMLDAIADGVALCRSWGAGSTVTTHNALFSTECPGSELTSLVKAGRFSGGSKPSTGGTQSIKPKPTSKPSTSKAPKFPLPRGHYFGPKSGPASSVSGYYSHRADLKRWQAQMRKRGWSLAADGLYGPRTASVARSFQRDKRLAQDGLIGKQTWDAAWNSKVT